MKPLVTAVFLLVAAFSSSCDFRSDTAKKEMETFSGTPTPTPINLNTPTPVPIDPADIVQVDTSLEGETLTANGDQPKKTINCKKFDRVMVNGTGITVNISGACRRIMVNGDGNQITADAAAEIVFNGTSNTLKYGRFVNGKQPLVTDNQAGNLVEKVAAKPQK